MKVLHLITGLHRGGAETMLHRLVLAMGLKSIVVSLNEGGEVASDLRNSGVKTLSLNMKRGQPSLRGVKSLRRIIREEQPDILQTWLYHADIVGLLASVGFSNLPLVWNLRCSDMDLSKYSWMTRAIRFLLAQASGFPTAVIANSEAGRQVHAALGYRPRHWEVIPNGFDTELFRPHAVERSTFRRALGIGDMAPLVGMVARVDPMKDHANFFAAAERIAIAREDIRFVLAGRGSDNLKIPTALRGRVQALGARSDIQKLFSAIDVLVVSSAFGEGFPNVIGEAMACGVPCVSTNVGDARQIIGETGLVVRPRDPIALSDAVLKVIGVRGYTGTAARQRIVDHYAINTVAERYRGLYEKLIESTKESQRN
jgi:glycosyltransferase involved in cell wall biosynthesis